MEGRVKLQPRTQTRIEVSTEKKGTIMVEPYHPIYNKQLCLSETGIADVKSGQPFYILVANFGQQVIDLLQHKVVVYASKHQETILESYITYMKMSGTIPDDVHTKFRTSTPEISH